MGNVVGLVVRWDTADGKKDYRPVSRFNDEWRIEAMPGPRPLYRLLDLAGAVRVYVMEGEKAADEGHSLGLVSTTSSGGANAATKSDWVPLAGKDVVILPDRNDAGEKYAEDVTDALRGVSPTPRVKVVRLPDLPEGGDLVDFAAARRLAGVEDDDIRAEIDTLVAKAPLCGLAPRVPDPTRYVPFPVDALPEPLRRFTKTAARAIGCGPSYVALPILAAHASAIGNTRRIRLKPGWSEPAILWTAIVGESGTMKSPALEVALQSVRRRQHATMRRYEEEMKRYREDHLRYERDLKQWNQSRAENNPPPRPEKPVPERVWCDDTTVEGLVGLLADQPRGLLMVRDELSGWLASFDRYAQGKGADAARWLEMFGGRPVVIDRKTSGTVYIPRAAVSIAGGIQPEILRRRLGTEHFENGLAARLLFAMPPRITKRWSESGLNPGEMAVVERVFERLYELDVDRDENGDLRPVDLDLTPAAKKVWIEFYNEHAEEQAELTGSLSAAWSKLEGYAARLALVVHLVRCAAGDQTIEDPYRVDEVSVASGITLSRWFGREAKRIYAVFGESEEDRENRELVDLIRRKGGSVTPRQLMRCSSRFQRAADARAALGNLAKSGYGRWNDPRPGDRGGRPSRRFVLVDGADVDETVIEGAKTRGFVNVGTVIETDEDLRAAWEERAAICEYDGGLSRQEAERIASEEIGNILALRQAG